MKEGSVTLKRETKETKIEMTLSPLTADAPSIKTGVPFFDHILYSMAFHGGFGLSLQATGDIEVDPHHLVEDVGIVLGDAFHQLLEKTGAVTRFGHAVIPMDDALSEAFIDVCERPYLVYLADYPQDVAGAFQMALLKEFFLGFVNHAKINLHLACRYGENSHHMAESLFKAFGKALAAAYGARQGNRETMSTKGTL